MRDRLELKDQVVVLCSSPKKQHIDPVFFESKNFDSVLELKLPGKRDVEQIIADRLSSLEIHFDTQDIVQVVLNKRLSFYEIVVFFDELKSESRHR